MRIHFVCSGNFYRSRLAEAYLKSKELPNVKVSSSGLTSDNDYLQNGPISWYAMRILKNNKLIPFMKKLPEQTTKDMLIDADLVIFMTNRHYEYAKEYLQFNGTYEVWNISDLDQFNDNDIDLQNELGRIQATEETFKEIKEKVDKLAKKL